MKFYNWPVSVLADHSWIEDTIKKGQGAENCVLNSAAISEDQTRLFVQYFKKWSKLTYFYV